MTLLKLIAVSSRTATVLLAPAGAKYALPEPVGFVLTSLTDGESVSGRTERAVLQLNDLQPDTGYSLTCMFGNIEFRTKQCLGAIDIVAHGADTSAADNSLAIQAAINSVPDGGTLLVPPGCFMTGPLFLCSRMTVHLAQGAELAAIGDWQDWPILEERDAAGRVIGTWEGLPERSFAALITAIGCTDITLTGAGIIDGGGDRGDWWTWPKETRRGARRPRTVFLAHCEHVLMSGLTIRNSPSWTVHPFHSRHVTAVGLKIENPPNSPNTDGLNPECCEETDLTGIHFSVGDDCIAVKSGKRDGDRVDHLAPTRNLTISHCLMEKGHGAVVLGSEMSGGISGVRIEHCRFLGTDRGLRIKTRRGRGGRVADISMTDVDMDRVATAFAANAFYFCDADGTSNAVQSRDPAPVDDTTPRITAITLKNVTATNVQLAAVALLGLPEAPFSDIRIENMLVSFDPDAVADVPLMACRVPACRHEAILAQFAEVDGGITLAPKDERHAD
ncbi:polygalacturonase PglA [Roseibium marinum]|uniref:polygalacturonase PglA n=1 Tax=Roseibium marinum TaxID=281252 RepID=UPI000CD10B9A|nr:glycoside hydrolase family 28 protein [Roseibium marinum]